MLIFLYILAAAGVAYWAKLDGRRADIWFLASIALTPLGSSVALKLMDKFGR